MGSLLKNEGTQKLKTTHKNTSRSVNNPYSSFFNQFSQQRPSSEINSMIPKLDPNNI